MSGDIRQKGDIRELPIGMEERCIGSFNDGADGGGHGRREAGRWGRSVEV